MLPKPLLPLHVLMLFWRFVGEEAILSGEAHCLADLNLQGAQSELIAALAKTGKPVVTVVMAGRPLTIGKEVELSSAVLYSFHPGTMGGPALADLLWGKAVPSGKTPVTFPKMVGQIPVYYAHNSSGRPATRNEVLLNDIPLEAGQTSLDVPLSIWMLVSIRCILLATVCRIRRSNMIM